MKTKGPNDISNGPHYAVIVFNKITVSHEAAGQWAPGHGYPAYTEEVAATEYHVFKTEQEVTDFVSELELHSPYESKKPYTVLYVNRILQVQKKVKLI